MADKKVRKKKSSHISAEIDDAQGDLQFVIRQGSRAIVRVYSDKQAKDLRKGLKKFIKAYRSGWA